MRKKQKLFKKPKYSASLKAEAISAYRMGIYTQAEICEIYQITPQLLGNWNRWYQTTYLNPFYQQKMKKEAEEKETIKQLKEELEGLHQQLKDARLRITILEKLIQVAEKGLGISLKKNFGSRQSRR